MDIFIIIIIVISILSFLLFKFHHHAPVDNMSAFQLMSWQQMGDKPLAELLLIL